MGFAKYAEDDMEIILERQLFAEYRGQENCIKKEKSVSVPKAYREREQQTHRMTDENDCLRIMRKQYKRKYTDKVLYCSCCGKKFLFSAYAQEQYGKKGWLAPKRCKSCRDFYNAQKLMRQLY